MEDSTTLAPTKRCSRCGEDKLFGEFGRDKSKPLGLASRCRICDSIFRKERHAGNPLLGRSRVYKHYYSKSGREFDIAQLEANRDARELTFIDGEEWRVVIEATGYEVSNLGRVRNASSSKLMLGYKSGQGYRMVRLKVEGQKPRGFRVHRLVASAFLGELDNEDIVDHMNRIRDDNRLENLRIVDQRTNCTNKNSAVNVAMIRQISSMIRGGISEEDILHHFRNG